jgi:hypothetical protein
MARRFARVTQVPTLNLAIPRRAPQHFEVRSQRQLWSSRRNTQRRAERASSDVRAAGHWALVPDPAEG